jgi:hypothetical protein
MAATQLNGMYTMEEAWYESTGKPPRKDEQIISGFGISSARLYEIKGAVEDIVNESNAISIRFRDRINYAIRSEIIAKIVNQIPESSNAPVGWTKEVAQHLLTRTQSNMRKKAGRASAELGLRHGATNSAIGYPCAEPQDVHQSLLPKHVDKYDVRGLVICICRDPENIPRSTIHMDLGASLLRTNSAEGWTSLLDFPKFLNIAQDAGVNLETEELWADTVTIMPVRNVGLLKYAIRQTLKASKDPIVFAVANIRGI